MKKLWLCVALALSAALVNSLFAQMEGMGAGKEFTTGEFNNLLRELDLNENTQKNFSITKDEYKQLLDAWNSLPEDARLSAQNENKKKDFTTMLLFDLFVGTPWEKHIKKAGKYGAKGISITVSRYKNLITLKNARRTLVDLLQQGSHMFGEGRLVVSDHIKKQAEKRAGGKALKRLNKWETLINRHQNDADFEKLKVVVDFFKDQINVARDWGKTKGNDYWQSPIETLVRGKGDCDDFAMAHYVSLRLLGIPAEQLRIGIVQHPYLGGHGVVFFYPPNERDPWVLDSMASDRLGAGMGKVFRLSVRMKFDEMKPLWGINEKVMTEFQENLNEAILPVDPREAFPAFATALANSQRLLPPEDVRTLAYTNTIQENEERDDSSSIY